MVITVTRHVILNNKCIKYIDNKNNLNAFNNIIIQIETIAVTLKLISWQMIITRTR